MKKSLLKKHIGKTYKIIADRLGYSSESWIKQLPKDMTDNQAFKILQRMKKHNIPIPDEMKLL